MAAPPVIAASRPRSWWWLSVALPMLGAVVVLFLFNPSQHTFYPRCTLYMTTGIYCPGCGSLRAMYHLSHGHLLTALHDNLLLMFALPVVGLYEARCFLRWLKGQPLPRFTIHPRGVKILIAITIVFTILRNIPGAPFNWLAPT